MDLDMIEFIDGYSHQMVNRVSRETLPEHQKSVFLKGGIAVPNREDADELIPIVQVVSTPLDAQENPVPVEQAHHIVVREYDALGQCQRTTLMHRRS